jgi:hypothetical protein
MPRIALSNVSLSVVCECVPGELVVVTPGLVVDHD